MNENYYSYIQNLSDEDLQLLIFQRLRGRPDDPRNRAIDAAKASLAQTIKVHSLSPYNFKQQPTQLEIARSRHHYNEFRKNYSLKRSQLSLRPPVIREVSNQEIFKLDEAEPSKLSSKLVERKPFTLRPGAQNSRHSIAGVKSESLDAEGEHHRRPDEFQALLLLKKLKELEAGPSKPCTSKASQHSEQLQCSQFSQYSVISENAATQSVLEQAEKEASVAQEQLAAIQRLFSVDRATSKPSLPLATIDEEIDEPPIHPKLKQKQLVDNVKAKISKEKKKNMVITLTNLNQRIQRMHDKYFSEPRFELLSIKDVKRRRKFEKNIEQLYKNNDFDPDTEISEVLLTNEQTESEKKNQIMESAMGPTKPVSIIRKAFSFPSPKHDITADISSDNYLQNKQLKHIHFDESEEEMVECFSEQNTKLDEEEECPNATSKTSITYQSFEKPSVVTDETSGISRYQSAKIDVILSPKPSARVSDSDSEAIAENSQTTSTLRSIQDSILRSQFLMKEFDVNHFGKGQASCEASCSGKRSQKQRMPEPMESYPSLHEFFSATSHKSKSRQDGQVTNIRMEDCIRTQLKNSLYDIF